MRATLLGAIGALLLIGGEAMAIEEPAYEVVETRATHELRRYAPMLVAEVELAGDFDDVGSEAFRILFQFISGENQSREEISMTAPVAQEPAGETIEMTAPVAQTPATDAQDRYRIHFVMPARYTRETLPVPTDPRITIRELPTRLVAARRYSGFWSEKSYRAQEAALLEALEAAGLEPTGPPSYARYNSPFSLWFLRRNEVLIPVAEAPES